MFVNSDQRIILVGLRHCSFKTLVLTTPNLQCESLGWVHEPLCQETMDIKEEEMRSSSPPAES